MRARRIDIIGFAACLAALAGACGSSGGGGAGGSSGGGAATGAGGTGGGACQANGPGSTPGSSMDWVVDGTAECANFVSATRSTKNGFDILAVTGTNPQNYGVVLKVTVVNGALDTKAYPCDGVYDLLEYVAGPPMGVGVTYPAQSCTITLTSLGSTTTPATGTFSAVLAGDAAAQMVSDGTFTTVPHVMN